mmetsp:Transcript_2899/g.8491  ORF Transcript_2899/g.8491 Transcript_2899/m.8491 type:complete len:224 (-) Transcript_2899:22-693(-)
MPGCANLGRFDRLAPAVAEVRLAPTVAEAHGDHHGHRRARRRVARRAADLVRLRECHHGCGSSYARRRSCRVFSRLRHVGARDARYVAGCRRGGPVSIPAYFLRGHRGRRDGRAAGRRVSAGDVLGAARPRLRVRGPPVAARRNENAGGGAAGPRRGPRGSEGVRGHRALRGRPPLRADGHMLLSTPPLSAAARAERAAPGLPRGGGLARRPGVSRRCCVYGY